MRAREARLAPPSLLRALRLLIPLALLGSALLGLLAQSASAHDAPVPAPSVTAAPSGVDSTPSWTYALPADRQGPAVATTDPATGTVTIRHRYSGECAYTRSTAVVDGDFAACALTFTGSTTTDGSYVFSVRAVETTESVFTPDVGSAQTTVLDPRRLSEVVQSTYLHDGNAPVLTIGPPQSGGDRAPSFAVSLQDATATTFTCAAPGATCTVSAGAVALDLSGRPDGTYSVSVTAVDAGGRSTTVSSSYTLSTFAVGATGPTEGRSLTPTWTFTGSPVTSATCAVTGPGSPTVTCGPTGFTASLPEGKTAGSDYTVTVDVVDAVGNTARVIKTYRLDTLATTTPGTSPASPGRTKQPTWTFTPEPGATSVTCVLSDGRTPATTSTADCAAGSYTAPVLPDTTGTTWTLTVTVVDRLGNTDATTLPAYLLDTVVELTPGTSPASPGSTRQPTWTFAPEAGATSVTCVLTNSRDALTYTSPCASGTYTAPVLPETPSTTWTLTVTVVDRAGGSRPFVLPTYLLDTTPPLAQATSPAETGKEQSPRFTFVFEAGAKSVTCRLVVEGQPTEVAGTCAAPLGSGAGSFTPSSPLPTTAGTTYSFTITVVDQAGNPATSVPVTYRLDTTGPSAVATSPATTGKDPSPVFTYTFEAGAASVTCQLLTAGSTTPVAGACTSDPVTGTGSFTPSSPLPPTAGTTYSFTITVVDRAGNPTTSRPVTYLLDTTPPTASAKSPATTGNDRSPTFGFTFETGAKSVTCQLVVQGTTTPVAGSCTTLTATTGTFTPTSPLPTTDATTYSFTVTVVDQAGNPTTSAAVTYLLDTTPPPASATSPAVTGKERSPTFGFTFEAGAKSVTCRLVVQGTTTPVAGTCTALTATTGTFTPSSPLPTTDGTTYSFTVTVVDQAGNPTTSAPVTYLLDTTAPAAAATSPAVTDSDPRPTFAFTFETGATSVTCSLVDSAGTAVAGTCDAPLSTGRGSFTPTAPLPTPTTGRTYSFTVTVVDRAGNAATSVPVTYRLDTVAELTPVTAPASPGADTTPTWTFTPEAGAQSVTCVLTNDQDATTRTASCAAGSYTAPVLPPTTGTTWTLTVTVTDGVGNARSFVLPAYELDTIVELTPGTAPTSPGADTTPTWTFTPEAGAKSVTCVLTNDRDATTHTSACGSGSYTAPVLPATTGTRWTLTVTVVDRVDGARPFVLPAYVLDTIAELVPGTAPASPGTDTTPTWTFTPEAGAKSATCVLTNDRDATTYTSGCGTGSHTSPALPGTPGTTWTLTVTVVDRVDNVRSFVLPAYLLDTVVQLTPGTAPPTPGRDRQPQWTFTLEADVRSATCVLSNDRDTTTSTSGCASGSYTAPLLPETPGTTWTLTVAVVDRAGGTQQFVLPAYLLDTVVQLTPGTSPASPGADTTPTWTFRPETGTRSVTCVLRDDTGATADTADCAGGSYTAPALPATAGTTWTLTVTVVDRAGGTRDVALAPYRLDTVAVLSAVVAPVSPSPDTTPTWTFTLEAGATATCALTGPGAPAAAVDCTSGSFTPPALPATPGADYVLTVTVTDALRNVTPYVQAPFRLDTVLPTTTIAVPAGPTRATTATFTVAVDEALQSASCVLRRDGTVVLTLADCPGSTTVALPGDGQYDVVVTAVDLAGNASTTTSALLVHDATVPTAPVVSPGSTTTNRTTAVWTVTGEGGTAVTTCRVLRGTQVVQDTVPCSGTFSVDLPGDGEYVLEAVSTDPVGPGPVTRATYLLDTVLPTAPLVAGPTGPAQGRAPSWTVSTESGTTTECQLVRDGTVVNAWAPCSGGFGGALDGLPDGGYVLESRATDAAGNLGPVGRSAPYVLDTTAPLAPVVTGPTGPSQDRRPGFTWTGEAGSTATCTLVRDGEPAGGPVPCARTFTLTLDRDGTWTVTVQVTDAAGNVSPAAVSAGYVLDTTPPEAPIVTPPQTPGRDLAPSWGAVVEGGARLECRLTGADGVATEWTACALPLSTPLTGRPDGTYVLEVRATDAAGNLSPVGRGTYVLDTVAPAAAVVVGPAGGRSRTPVFSWTVEPGASTRCRLNSGATVVSEMAACTSPATLDLTGLPDGAYTLTVRVTDAAGNPGPAATGTYVLDTTGPAAPVLILAPASPSPSRSPVYAFTSELGSTLVCRLAFPTGAVREISPCASPLTLDLTGLPDGSYTLTVRAVDAAGNLGAVLTEVHVLDSGVLAAPVLLGPTTPGSGRTPRWTLAPAPGAASTECRLTRGTTVLRDWIPCTTGYTADLFGQPDGTYVLSARSRDAAGAVSAAAQSRYVLDTTAPGGAVVTPPPTPSTNRLPTWTIASADAGASAECRLLVFGSVLRDWAPCAVTPAGSPYAVDLSGLGDGTYTLVVRLTDAAGNRSAVEVSSAYVLDTSAPVAVGVTPPPSPGNDRTPTWLLTSGAGVLLECRLSSAAGVVSDWAPCAGEYTADLAGLPDGTYVLAVRAVSAAGTPGPDTTRAYTLSTSAPLAPTALALSGGTTPTDNDRSPVWTFTLLDGTTATCRVVSGSTVLFDGPCTSPFRLDLSRAQDGSFTLTVRAVSAAGTPGAAATSTYVLDTVATSAPVFTSVPGATGSTLDPRWTFTVARGAKAQCRLLRDGVVVDDWTACSTPFTAQLSGRPDGAYELQVRAVDSAGNTSEPASSTYRLDRTALPLTSFTTTPAPTGSSGSLLWTVAPAAGTTAECRLVGPDSSSGWAPCAGPVPVDVTGRPDGTYALEARTIGADGARGAASSSTYQLDTKAPARPGFTVVPTPAVGSDPAPVWSWSTAADEMVECRLVRLGGGPVVDWRECTDGQYVADLTRFGQGGYALELRTTDAAGNTSPANSASYTWDARAPDAPTFLSRPATSGADRTVSWTFVVPGGTRATCTISRDRSVLRESACAGRYDLDLTGLPDGTYVLAVRLTDTAGNTGSPATSAYALRTSGLGGAGRVDVPPFRPEPAPVLDPPTGPGRIGTGAPSLPLPLAPAPLLVRRVVDGLDEQLVPRSPQGQPAGGGVDEPAPGAAEPEPRPTETNPLLPQALPAGDLPQVVRELVTGTATKPTLPLALLAIVVLFLLAQNRIDRRDPKLAAAPVEAEPELDFTAFIRRPGAAT